LSFAGKPLIAWTIEEAKKSEYIDQLILSSDDEEIVSAAKSFGCEVPFLRPVELAQDDTPIITPVFHALEKLSERYDYVVLLQPTSPLRRAEDIDRCIEQCIERKWDSCVSVTESEKSPYWMYILDDNGKMQRLINLEKPIDRRQDLPKVYALNGAVYIAQVEWLLNNRSFITDETHAYIMPKERSVDIDDEMDFKLAEFLLQKSSYPYVQEH
jgi:N-acylneuraminate cytidylyltransferase